MATLYLDNFRGFSNTTIPLKSVNFLIGENSTGKSSVLALLHLLCSPDFWFSQNFNLQDYEFGGFLDILSATAEDRNEFTIGYHQRQTDPKTKTEATKCYLQTFIQREALPSASFIIWMNGKKLLFIRIIKDKYQYKAMEAPKEWTQMEPPALFTLLQGERQKDHKDFKVLPGRISSPISLITLLAILEQMDREGEQKAKEIAFPPIPILTRDLVWFAPIRTKPKRTYDGYGRPFSSEGEHTPYLLQKRLMKRSTAFQAAIESFGKESGLFNKIIIKRLGKDPVAPFELLVELAPKCLLRVNSVGYGVSQALPLAVEMLARKNNTWFAIQQPEVHLHPKAQAALGDMIYQVSENEKKNFLIETHSDFTIDRFRMNFRRNAQHKTEAQVLFFQRSETGNQVSVIPIQKNGEYADQQPVAFREFFLKEQMDLLDL